MSDARFFDCTLQLMATLTHPRKGNWAGDIIVLETPGPNRFMVNERTMFSKTYARTHCVKATYELPPTPNYGIGPTMQFAKVSLLTDPRFRVYRKLLYLDSDIVVKKPIHPLFDTDLPAKKSAAFRDNGVAFGKMNFYRNEIDTAVRLFLLVDCPVAQYSPGVATLLKCGSQYQCFADFARLSVDCDLRCFGYAGYRGDQSRGCGVQKSVSRQGKPRPLSTGLVFRAHTCSDGIESTRNRNRLVR